MSKKRFQLKEASYRNSERASLVDQALSELEVQQESVSEADRTQVELWAAELVLLTKEFTRSIAFNPESALRLLAGWARLARVEPAALPRPEPAGGPLTEAFQSVRDNSAQLIEAAIAVAGGKVDAWLKRAEHLKESYLDSRCMHPKELERNATSLLLDLDDMELAGYAAKELNHPAPLLCESISRCRHWLTGNIHAFVSCGRTIAAEPENHPPRPDQHRPPLIADHTQIFANPNRHRRNGTRPLLHPLRLTPPPPADFTLPAFAVAASKTVHAVDAV